jgi:ubiquinone/menaquinone biosynthesis C-methylase UbiE
LTGEAAAHQAFLAASRRFWAGPLFQAVQRQTAALAAARQIDLCGDAGAFAAMVHDHPTHAMFAWFERHLQRMKYSGRWGLATTVEAKRDALLAQVAEPCVTLTLDPALRRPSYWLDHDIHQHPGGLAGELAGFVYQEASGQGGVVGRPELHERFAQTALAGRSPNSILDLGCGFGRSTVAFAAAAPAAHVTGADLSASCLRIAAANVPAHLRAQIDYRQADATSTDPETAPGAYDLVTSTMLLHELPSPALDALIAETGRLLAPGGVAIHLDFLPPADPLLRILYDGHSARNNEPFMADLARADLAAAHRRAGFERLDIIPFAETDGALDMPQTRWRLPWTIVVATMKQEPTS